MTARAEYTDEEWGLIVAAPWIVAAAVVFAEPGGELRELVAAVGVMADARERFPGNELIAAVTAPRAGQGEPSRMAAVDPDSGDVAGALLERAVNACHDVDVLLADRSNAVEADGMRRLLADVAESSAQAASTGGVLGFGGVRVTAAERVAVDAVRRALGFDPLPLEPGTAPGDGAGISGQPPRPDTIRPDRNGTGGAGIPSGPIHPS